MPKRSSKNPKPDLNTIAYRVVKESTSEAKKKNPAAVALGKLGGLKGGMARARRQLQAGQTVSIFPQATLNAQISRCVCQCAVLHVSRMRFQRSWKTTKRRLRSILCTIISLVFTKHCASRQQWKQGLQLTFGRWKKLWHYSVKNENNHYIWCSLFPH